MSVSTPATIRPTGKVVACAQDPKAREHLELSIRKNGYESVSVGSLEELRSLLLNDMIAAAVIDEPTSMEEIEYLDAEIRRAERPTQFILIPSIGHRITPPRNMACEVVDPPLTPDRIGRALFSSIARAQLITENIQLKQKLEGRMFDGLVGVSEQTRDLRNQIHAAAEHDHPVLIQGEVGCGKSEVARAVHLTRSGPGEPLLTIRCSLLTSAVIEKELYGDDEHPGRFAAAANGTMVFEDVEQLTIPLQSQLAEIVRNGAYRNGENFVPLRARIIATSSQDLEALAKDDKFDAGLLNVLQRTQIAVTPLRTRMEDMPVLAEHFMQQASVREGQSIRRLSNEAYQRLTEYDWPGNARELENVISRCCSIASSDVVTAEDIEPWLEQTEEAAEAPGMTLREMERKLIEATFNRFGGNRELTAKALKIGIRTLSGKLREYGYPPRGGPGSNRKSA